MAGVAADGRGRFVDEPEEEAVAVLGRFVDEPDADAVAGAGAAPGVSTRMNAMLAATPSAGGGTIAIARKPFGSFRSNVLTLVVIPPMGSA